MSQDTQKLTSAEIDSFTDQIPTWSIDESQQSIYKEFTFQDFGQAWGFMTQVALLAEKLQHHPEWSNCYHRVSIKLTTHDCEGLSYLDFILAQQIDQISQ